MRCKYREGKVKVNSYKEQLCFCYFIMKVVMTEYFALLLQLCAYMGPGWPSG